MSTLLKVKRPIRDAMVQVSDEEGFLVRGLTPHQVLALYYRHVGQLGEIFARVANSLKDTGNAERTDIETIVISLIGDAPEILAELIVLASGGQPDDASLIEVEGDDGDQITTTAWLHAVSIARLLPISVQVDAVQKIGDLTFTSEMPLGKFAALVGKAARGVAGALTPKSSPEQ